LFQWWSDSKSAAILFVGAVWLPLTVKYGMLLRRNIEANRHLVKRMIGISFIAIPWVQISAYRLEKHGQECSAKYFHDLSDYEKRHFSQIYMKQQEESLDKKLEEPQQPQD